MTKAAELAKMGEVLTNSQIGGRRNIIINGAMQVAQRSTSETGIGSGAVDTYKTLDRVGIAHGNTDGRLTMSQTADGPSGFANCLKLDCTTADTSIAAGEYLQLKFKFEGQDLQQFKKGTSDAEKITFSFYVKGNGNATYMCELEDHDNGRNNQQQFAVTSSWSRVVLTFNADTTGAFDDDNALSLSIIFWLHAGSTYTGGSYTANTWTGSVSAANRAAGISSFFSSTDNNFFLTGVQLEVGEQATPFEHRSFGEELALCQRYFYVHADGRRDISEHIGTGTMYTSGSIFITVNPKTIMRAVPSLETTTGTNFYQAFTGGASDHFDAITLNSARSSVNLFECEGGTNVSGTASEVVFLRLGGTSNTAKMFFDAEL